MLLLSFGSNLSSTFGDRFTNIDLAVKFIESDNLKPLEIKNKLTPEAWLKKEI